MSALAQLPLSVRTHHKVRKIRNLCIKKCARPLLKNPFARTEQPPPLLTANVFMDVLYFFYPILELVT